jgi:hypothetical protein
MFLILNGCVTTAYALLQVWQPPAWDVAWALNSGTDNAVTVETQWRVFGTLNSVGVFAPWMVTLLVLSLHFRGILSVVILPAAGLLLLLTGVRSALVSLLLSLGVAAAIGGWRISGGLLSLGTAMIMLGLAFGSFNPDVADRLVMRYGSLTELQYDDSALTRAEIWRHTPEMIDSHPYGMGLGAIGRGAVVASNFDFVSIDFGVLAIYLSLGWVAGTIYIFSMVAAVATGVWHALRSKDPAAVVCAAASVGIVSLLPIANVVGFQGATLWLSAGLATALGMRSDRQRKAAVSLGQVCLGPSRRIRAQQEP